MEEKMMVLRMLQEGKITADEAAKLLDAIDKGKGSENNAEANDYARRTNFNIDEKVSKISEKATKFAEQVSEKATRLAEQITENVNNNKGKISSDAEKFAGDFSKRMEVVGNDIAESAVKFADRLVTQLGGIFDIASDKCRFTNNYVYPIIGTPNITLSTHNFSVKVNTSDAENIMLNMYINSDILDLTVDEFFKAEVDGNNFNFSTRFPGRTWGRIELLVPKTLGNLNITTENGKCELSDVVFDIIKCRTANSKITCYNCHGRSVEALTDNSKISFDGFSAKEAVLRTSNGKIELDGCKLDSLDAITSNAAVQMSRISKLDASEAKYNLYTSNGKIAIELDKNENCGYLVDAHTSLGGIHITLPEMSYFIDKKTTDMQSTALVKSTNFDAAENKIIIKANTSNASISIDGQN